MERMEEYQRMREEEAGRPVPAELACLETRVRARAAKRPRRRRGPVLAAVCLCLVLGTGMAWGMGGFAALDRLLGENAGQLIPFYQEVGERSAWRTGWWRSRASLLPATAVPWSTG